jgi:hypothetical protein
MASFAMKATERDPDFVDNFCQVCIVLQQVCDMLYVVYATVCNRQQVQVAYAAWIALHECGYLMARPACRAARQ